MEFISSRKFNGIGYASDMNLLKAIDILSYGKMVTFALCSTERCDDLIVRISPILKKILHGIHDSGVVAMNLIMGSDSNYEKVRIMVFCSGMLRRKFPFCFVLTDE